jgi:hypothetical protein
MRKTRYKTKHYGVCHRVPANKKMHMTKSARFSFSISFSHTGLVLWHGVLPVMRARIWHVILGVINLVKRRHHQMRSVRGTLEKCGRTGKILDHENGTYYCRKSVSCFLGTFAEG